MSAFPHLAARLFNTPLVVRADKAEVIVAAVADRFGVSALRRDGDVLDLRDAARLAFLDGADPRMTDRVTTVAERGVGYDVVEGIAVIGVEGILVQRLGALRPQSGMTGYDGLRANLTTALRDPKVRGIALLCNSPGGEAAGCADLADQIAASRNMKPIWAILDEMACSGCYWLAAACSVVTMPRLGTIGSIGAVIAHTEASRALDRAGITVTVIRDPSRKMEGNDMEPLTRDALDHYQASATRCTNLFIESIARYRGLDPAALRAMRGIWVEEEDGLAAGLADAVLPADDAFQALVEAAA